MLWQLISLTLLTPLSCSGISWLLKLILTRKERFPLVQHLRTSESFYDLIKASIVLRSFAKRFFVSTNAWCWCNWLIYSLSLWPFQYGTACLTTQPPCHLQQEYLYPTCLWNEQCWEDKPWLLNFRLHTACVQIILKHCLSSLKQWLP